MIDLDAVRQGLKAAGAADDRVIDAFLASWAEQWGLRLVEEVGRYRELCRRLTVQAGPNVGEPLLINGSTPDYATGGDFCLWCGAIRRAGDKHSPDCPWPEVLREAGL